MCCIPDASRQSPPDKSAPKAAAPFGTVLVKWHPEILAFSIFVFAGCVAARHPLESDVALFRNVENSDAFKIDRIVYGYLLQRHFWDNGEYSAVFLQGSDAEVAALIRTFPDHIPPIKTGDRAVLHPNQTPIDRETGRPAMILSVDALDPTNGTVEAVGTWYAGEAVSGLYTFVLKKTGDDWVLESVR